MKKIIIALLLCVFVLAACNSKKDDTPQTTTPQESSPVVTIAPLPTTSSTSTSTSLSTTAPPTTTTTTTTTTTVTTTTLPTVIVEEESLQSKEQTSLIAGGVFYIEYTLDVEIEGKMVPTDGSLATDGKNTVLLSRTHLAEGVTTEGRVIMKDNVSYMVDDTNKIYMDMGSAIVDSPLDSIFKLTYRYNSAGEINGKVLPFEEYVSENGEYVRFYFDGENLSVIEAGDYMMHVTAFSVQSPAGLMDIPPDYTKLG